MKKLLAFAMSLLLMTGASVTAAAVPGETRVQTIPLENGYAIVTTVVEEAPSPFLARASTRKASKTYKAYNFSDRLLWIYTLTGEFTYGGGSATAIKAYDSYSISDSVWSKDYSSTDYSGDTVYGDAAFSCPTDEQSCSLSITCGPNGEIS